MQKSKLIALLKSFSKQEMKSFNDFVFSPYFNKEKVLVKLVDFLSAYHPHYNVPGLEKENVFENLYPGKTYNDGLMRNIISDMLALAEEYLVLKNLNTDEFRKNILLIKELKSRKLANHFLKHKEKTENLIEQSPFKDEFYYDKKTELSRLYSSFLKETEDTYIRENQLFQENSDLITSGFLIKILYYNTYMLTRQSHISNFSFILNFAGEIDNFFRNEGVKFLEITHIECYYYCFKLIQTNDETYFYKLKDFIKNNFDKIDREAGKSIHTVMENYCYTKVTEGKVEFVKEQFLLYKQSIEKGTYKGVVDYISNIFFVSVTATGFEAGEFEWVEKFIREYIHEVKDELRQNTLHFCNALNFYWKKKFEESLVELSKVSTEEFAFKHNIKSLMLKIYYDLNESESFYSHIDTYKHFILNNRIVHDKVREQVNNFINYSKKLFSIKNSENVDKGFELNSLKNEISENHTLINKIWLLKKTAELTSK
jgi:hypothetical protein